MSGTVGDNNGQLKTGNEVNNTARILLEVSRLVNSSLDPDEVLHRILDSVDLVLPYDYAVIQILQGRVLHMKTCIGFSHPEELKKMQLPLDQFAVNKEIIDTGLPVLIGNVQKDRRWICFDEFAEYRNVRSWMGVPLSANGRPIGILELGSNMEAVYTSSHVFFAAAFASHVSIAYENARLYAETRKRVEEMAALNKVSAAANDHLELEELCKLIGETIDRLLVCDVIYLAILDEDRETIHMPFFRNKGKKQSIQPFKLGEGLTSRVLESGKQLLLDHDADEQMKMLGGIQQDERKPKTWLGLPLLSGDKAIGVLSVQHFTNEYHFSEDDIRLLATLAASASSAIQNVLLYKETQRREKEALALAEIGREVSSSLNFETVVKRIVELAHPLLSHEASAIFTADGSGTRLKAVSVAGKSARIKPGSTIANGVGVIGRTAVEGKVNVDNGLNKYQQQAYSGEKLMAIPLMMKGRILGVLVSWRNADEGPFTRHDIQFGENIARQTSVALRNAQLFQIAESSRREAEMANTLKSQFLANMSHELRTPLNSIINFAFLIKQEMPEEQFDGQIDMLQRIEESGRHLLKLINDILDLSKIESGRMELYFEDLAIDELIQGVMSTSSTLVSGKNIVLRTNIESGLPLVRGDRTRLRQVLLNLISNAAKFTQEGSITVQVEKESGFIRIHVIDTGIGMREEDIPRAFNEFVQLDGGSDRIQGGTGLGLPISKRFIEMQGGSFTVHTQPGKGSDFSFTIPLIPELPAALLSETTEPVKTDAGGLIQQLDPTGNPLPLKVLVIDDDEAASASIAAQLHKKWEVLQLNDPRKVVETVLQQKPDVLVLDIMMPYLDGWDILKTLKANPATSTLPVIMCSVMHQKSMALSLDAEDFLVKPVRKDDLIQAVSQVAPKGGRVLAVDDDQNALTIVGRILQSERYDVAVANCGPTGLDLAHDKIPDVIILDLLMPNMDGFAVLEKIRKDPQLAHIPIIVISSKDLTREEYKRLQDGMTRYLQKGSFSEEELGNVIKRLHQLQAKTGTQQEEQT
ncbi:MAG: GAF domain-containing protein [Spirochaetes bacterium]|nr:GAF domain-containing protein [Spirochaetota bacterium]MBU0956813.1 GAF domain-containing protein [Spirochaetota bacterium]